ncbi:MAG TPA: hypothetical protein ENJ06_02715 [Phycisphaeraceae bacterium]|nr:hypothetical protein [Phycisphaeraceae bacterium]
MFKKTIAVATLTLLAGSSAWAHRAQELKTYLNTLNNSGVHGVATVTLKGDTLAVTIHATGVEAGKPHPQHIHGATDGTPASCPDLTADTDGDNLVSVGEGMPSYGPIILPMTPFQTAEDGTIDYHQKFKLGKDVALTADVLGPLHHRTIVLHGLSISGEYVPTMPIACGRLKQRHDKY